MVEPREPLMAPLPPLTPADKARWRVALGRMTEAQLSRRAAQALVPEEQIEAAEREGDPRRRKAVLIRLTFDATCRPTSILRKELEELPTGKLSRHAMMAQVPEDQIQAAESKKAELVDLIARALRLQMSGPSVLSEATPPVLEKVEPANDAAAKAVSGSTDDEQQPLQAQHEVVHVDHDGDVDDARDTDFAGLSAVHRIVASFFLAERILVLSTPEYGSLDPANGKFTEPVMKKVAELHRRGLLSMGFDRAGTSTAHAEDAEIWDRYTAHLQRGQIDEAKQCVRETRWWEDFKSACKKAFGSQVQDWEHVRVVCIKGGPITQVEQEEMPEILRLAEKDARTNEYPGELVKVGDKTEDGHWFSQMEYREFVDFYDKSLWTFVLHHGSRARLFCVAAACCVVLAAAVFVALVLVMDDIPVQTVQCLDSSIDPADTCCRTTDLTCAPGCAGNNCTQIVPFCEWNAEPCKNGGLCESTSRLHHSCNCTESWGAVDCSLPIGFCEWNENPCQNGGICVSVSQAEYTCSCYPKWGGVDCITAVPFCQWNPGVCHNDGACVSNGQMDHSCICAAGWGGDSCMVPIEFCDWNANPCHNNGTCNSRGRTGYACTCISAAWGGINCDRAVGYCDFNPNPCQNGGNCVSTGQSLYACDCANTWTGEQCTIEVPYCESNDNPCKFGGTCVSQGRTSYTCDCAEGFTGHQCGVNNGACFVTAEASGQNGCPEVCCAQTQDGQEFCVSSATLNGSTFYPVANGDQVTSIRISAHCAYVVVGDEDDDCDFEAYQDNIVLEPTTVQGYSEYFSLDGELKRTDKQSLDWRAVDTYSSDDVYEDVCGMWLRPRGTGCIDFNACRGESTQANGWLMLGASLIGCLIGMWVAKLSACVATIGEIRNRSRERRTMT